MSLKPLRTSGSAPRMPCMSMIASIVAFTERSWIWRCWATAATPAVRQLPRATSTYSAGVDPIVLGGELQRVVGVVAERRPVLLLLVETVERVHLGLAVRPAHPAARRAPLELRDVRGVRQRVADPEQGFDVDAIVDRGVSRGHCCSSFSVDQVMPWPAGSFEGRCSMRWCPVGSAPTRTRTGPDEPIVDVAAPYEQRPSSHGPFLPQCPTGDQGLKIAPASRAVQCEPDRTWGCDGHRRGTDRVVSRLREPCDRSA